MKNDSRSSSTLWVLLLSYIALFVLLVIGRNVQFWHLREKGQNLVEVVSASNYRQSVFNSVYKADMDQQGTVWSLLNSDDGAKIEGLNRIVSEGKTSDSLLRVSQKLLQDPGEIMLFNHLKELSKSKAENLGRLLELIKAAKYDDATHNYIDSLSPQYRQFQLTNTKLIHLISNTDKKNINETKRQITTISTLNIWISAALIIVLISLGINLVKIIRINRKTLLELKESERKYRTLTEQTNEIIVKFDAKGKFVFANDSFKKRLEYNDEDLGKLSLSDILYEGSPEAQYRKKGNEVITNVQKVFKSKHGKRLYMEGNIVVEYRNGTFAGSMGFFNDATEKKQLEESLVNSELKFRTFFNVAPIPMWAFDPDTYRFVLVNKAAVTHYGFTEKEFLDKTIMDIRQPDNLSKIQAEILRMKEDTCPSQTIFRSNLNHFKKSGEKIEVEIFTSPVIIDGNKCIIMIAIDVTERNQNENKITKAIIKTQEDERYEIGSELHDNVCQILAAAKMSLTRMEPSLIPSVMDLYRQTSDGILLAIEEVRNLSHRLAPAFFDSTRLEEAFEGLLRTFNIRDTCNIFMYFNKGAKNYPISQEIQLNLYRMLQEQLRNIIKHSNCTIIEVEVTVCDQVLEMRIADNGKGFDFNQVKEGIGLANIKRRAEMFSGEFKLKSSPGNGCELLITIPVHKI